MRKLNIGSGDMPIEGYVNIDNGYDGEMPPEVILMDGNNMSFEDESFDEIRSNQCVGEYVTNYKEIVRVLKPNGRVWLGVWLDKVNDVIDGLLKFGIRITKIDLLNGSLEDDTRTYSIEGYKEEKNE